MKPADLDAPCRRKCNNSKEDVASVEYDNLLRFNDFPRAGVKDEESNEFHNEVQIQCKRKYNREFLIFRQIRNGQVTSHNAAQASAVHIKQPDNSNQEENVE
jgi:hypothetical protein